MKTETASVATRTPPPKSGAAWKATLILIPVLTALVLFWLRHQQVKALSNRPLSSYGRVPNFELVNQDGEPFGSKQLTGKIWISALIFTTCRGPCPIISTRMSELQKPLSKSDVHLVSITVDPETDTPPVLRAYADKLRKEPFRWDFLTGPVDAITSLSRDGFKLATAEEQEPGMGPVHSTRFVLIDRRGTIRGYYDALAADGVTKLLADTNHLLREQPKL
ncbi:MAG TPA: SCO family protein [Chthoniobacterales bacterium]|jgi:protein SCO1/2|nr:SCO family protein [Chthoniobacterales bacterium]